MVAGGRVRRDRERQRRRHGERRCEQDRRALGVRAARRTCRGSAARSARSAAERESTAAPATAVDATGRGAAASETVRAGFAGCTKEERATAGPRAARRPRGRRSSAGPDDPGAVGSVAADRAPSWAAGSACRPMVPSAIGRRVVDRLRKITYWSRSCDRQGWSVRFLRFVSACRVERSPPRASGAGTQRSGAAAVRRARGGSGRAPARGPRRGGPRARSGCRRAV